MIFLLVLWTSTLLLRSKEEYDEVIDYALKLGIKNGFIQEDETDKASFIPSFNGEGV